MKTNTIIAPKVLVIGVAFIFLSCNNSIDENILDAKKDAVEANKALHRANEEYLADIASYRLQINAEIALNDSLIFVHRVNLKSASKHTNSYYIKEIGNLEKKNKEMKNKMDTYVGEGKDKWTIFKEEFRYDMNELGGAIKNLTVNNIK